nr:unnamed protein product [Callosobruchus analis]
MGSHPARGGNRITNRCIHCNKTFVFKRTLDDHIVKRHPDFIASVSRKVHECTKCSFKTVSTNYLKRHMVSHQNNHIFSRCIYCNNTFTCQRVLDDHIVKRHPDFIASVSRKVHECTKCAFKTVRPSRLKEHIKVKHPDRDGNRCIYCNKTFVQKQTLDDHIVKTHPDFIASVNSKIYECIQCTYKTTISKDIREHLMSKHHQIADNHIFIRCIYCNDTFVSKPSLDDHIVKRHPDFIASVSRKIHECTNCTFKTIRASRFKEHIKAKHPDIAGDRLTNNCIYCNKTFVRKITLNDHIVKRHPDFKASVGRTIHECTKCTYKTVNTSDLKRHIMVKHPDIAGHRLTNNCSYCNKTFINKSSLDDHILRRHAVTHDTAGNRITIRCIYCNKTFTTKQKLDEHIIKTHPDFIASVSSKVHECTECTYKTTNNCHMKQHMVKHGNHISNRCIHCNKTFKTKQKLDDHIIKKHPDFIAFVTSKVHECTECTYKTTDNSHLKQHMAKHPDVAGNHIPNRCIHCNKCNKAFTTKKRLDDHIIKKHPDFISSVSSKVHECTECTYKTTDNSNLKQHMLKHPDIAGNHITNRCIHCNKTFTTKKRLDDHIMKKHPDFIASVTSKVHQCTECTYKTTNNSHLRRHMVKHPDIAASVSGKVHECTECTYKTVCISQLRGHMAKHHKYITNRCIYCNKTFASTRSLNDHIVKTYPDFIASVKSKIHECTQCTYKTTISKRIRGHLMAKHPEIADNRNRRFRRCIYCNKTFTRKLALEDHVVKRHPDFIASVSKKIYQCSKCTFKTVSTKDLKRHIMARHPDIAGNRKFRRCIYCSKAFVRRETLDDHTISSSQLRRHAVTHDIAGNRITIRCIYCNKIFTTKQRLDDHIIKAHPDFIASVSSKVHECTQCTYKTTDNSHLKQHMVKHADVADNHITNGCIYCNKTFKGTRSLDDHILRIHPDFIASVSSKVHECTECTYKTVFTGQLRRHMVNHSDLPGNHISNRCIHCNKIFTTKQRLDDHIIKSHPDFMASVTSKVHGCTECSFITTNNSHMKHHIAKHPAIAGNMTNRCIHCNKTFTTKQKLDEHILKTHPDFIASVSSKVHECTECTYKTTNNSHMKQHMVKHPDIAGNHITTRCIHCNKTFTTKQRLDDHIIKTHLDFIASVSSKVHNCTKCTYKTTSNSHLKRHMAKHSDIAGNRITIRCNYCNKTFTSTQALDDHILNSHPDFIVSVSSKIHECTKCSYKTTITTNLNRHNMTKHPEALSSKLVQH